MIIKRNLIILTVSLMTALLFIACEIVPTDTFSHTNPVDPDYVDPNDTTPPADIDLTALTAYYLADDGVALSWETPAEKVLLLKGTASIPDAPLTDGTAYEAGNSVGVYNVIYAGSDSSFTDTIFPSDGTYYYRLFAYDNSKNYASGGVEASTVIYKDGIYVHWNGSDTGAGTSGDPILSIQAGLNKAQEVGLSLVRVAGDGTEFYSYTGSTAVPAVVMKAGISLQGSYNPETWSDSPDVETWPSILEVTGPVSASVPTVRALNLSGTETLEGFRILGFDPGSGYNSIALLIANSDITVRGCEILGGNPTSGISYGILIEDASPTITYNISIAGGAPTQGASYGIYATGASDDISAPVIRYNDTGDACITGGTGSSYTNSDAAAIYFGTYTTGSIRGNHIQGSTGSVVTTSYGVRLEEAAPLIAGNIIRAEGTKSSSSNAFGIYLNACDDPVAIHNNFIGAINTSATICIEIYNSDVAIRNNTLYSESTNALPDMMIELLSVDGNMDDDVLIQNNILAGPVNYGIHQVANVSGLASYLVYNNNFSTNSVIYYDAPNSTGYNEVSLLNDTFTFCSGNLKEDLTIDTADGTVTGGASAGTFDTAGIDGSAAGWGFTTDLSGTTRTGSTGTGWSMGCYEYD